MKETITNSLTSFQEIVTDFGYEPAECTQWIPSLDLHPKIKCESGSQNYKFMKQYLTSVSSVKPIFGMMTEQIPTIQVVQPQNETDIKGQLEKLFTNIGKFSTILNKEEIINFLIGLPLEVNKITDSFLEMNKIISSKLTGNFKIFIQKYDDPETKDHFIAVFIRQKSYPDDFIDKIWEIRDIFLERNPNNDWILITTDYEKLTE